MALSPAIPARMITSPILTRRLPGHREFSRAWIQEPAVQVSVGPVTARPASTGVRCRRIVIVSVTNASAPKQQKVSRARLIVVAGPPYLADNVPAGIRRRSTGTPSAQPAAKTAQPAATLSGPGTPAAPDAPAPAGASLVADPTASVRPVSTSPAATATPTPSISRCPASSACAGGPPGPTTVAR